MRVLVTGGAGFIGSALCRMLVRDDGWRVLNLDKLTYAANLSSLGEIASNERYSFVQGDVCDRALIDSLLAKFEPDAIMHLAAESHVDRSIDGSAPFLQTNVLGTHTLLEAARAYWSKLAPERRGRFRFLHVSTDEVYGSLGDTGRFSESNAYDPRSPYAATKAAADHLARAWLHTYGLPVLVSNSSNNYGPYHFPEKLIPLAIVSALEGKPIRVYGDGANVRDWLYVDDHVAALRLIVEKGKVGETYNVGANQERRNIDVVNALCELLDELAPKAGGGSHRDLIEFVEDRPGHDRRYAIDSDKLRSELGWRPQVDFEAGLRRTVEWYLAREDWWRPILREEKAGRRLGLPYAAS